MLKQHYDSFPHRGLLQSVLAVVLMAAAGGSQGSAAIASAPRESAPLPCPPPPQFFWMGTPPGRVRGASWYPQQEARGTLFLLPGRSSILGLRLPFLQPVVQEGWAIYTLDWRGQGESERWLANTHLIDLPDSFDAYVEDVQQLIQRAKEEGAPRPYAAVGVSLGGHILLRALEEGAPLQAAVLQVPLCDVKTGWWPSSGARWFARTLTRWGWGERAAPGQPRIDIEAILKKVPPSPAKEIAARYIAAHPETLSDTVTIRWADAMFRSIEVARQPERLARIQAPVLLVAATHDQICDTEACKQIVQFIPQGEYSEVEGDHFFFTQAQIKLRGLQQQVRDFFQRHLPQPQKEAAQTLPFLGA